MFRRGGSLCMARTASELMGTPDSLFHWIPGEIVLVVRLKRKPADELQETLVEQIRATLNTVLAAYQLTLEPYGSGGRWRETPGMPQIYRRAFIFGLHQPQPYVALFFHVRHADPTLVDPVPLALTYLQAPLEQLAQQGLALLSAMPNLLVPPAPLLFRDGGPALPPPPAPALDLPASGDAPLGWHFPFIHHIAQLHPTGPQAGAVAAFAPAYPAP